MSYAIHLESWYAVEAAWFYSRARGLPDLDEDYYEAAVQKAGGEREDAIVSLLRPHLNRLGFASDAWNVVLLTEDYLAYEGFPLRDAYDREFILFEEEALFAVTENLPSSRTFTFTPAHQQLVKLLDIDEVASVEVVYMERLEQEEEEEEEPDE
jgi:hypothetical protein